MGKDFLESDPEARDLCELTSRRCGRDLRRLMLEGPEDGARREPRRAGGVYLVSTLAARALERRGSRGGGDGGLQPRQLRGDGGGGIDLLRGGARRARRRLGGDRAPRHPRPHGRRVGARREAVDAECAALRERGLAVWIGNVNASTQFVLTGSSQGVGVGPRRFAAARSLGPPADDELADSQRAHAAGRGGNRSQDRRASDRSGTPAFRTTARRAGRSRAARTCGGFSERRSASRLSGRRPSRRWWRRATGSSSRPARGRCSRRWCAGSTARRAASPAGTVAAVDAAVDIVAAG